MSRSSFKELNFSLLQELVALSLEQELRRSCFKSEHFYKVKEQATVT